MTYLEFWGKELVVFAVAVPMLWYMIRQNTSNYEKTLIGLDRFNTSFSQHTKDDMISFNKITNLLEKQLLLAEGIYKNLSKVSLTDEQAVRLFKAEMWLTSRKKLNFIKDILMNNHIDGREEFIFNKLKLGLSGYSEEYIGNFKGYNCKIGDLGVWLNNNFTNKEFEDFCREIFNIMIRKDEGEKLEIIRQKNSEISLLMETLQNTLSINLKTALQS